MYLETRHKRKATRVDAEDGLRVNRGLLGGMDYRSVPANGYDRLAAADQLFFRQKFSLGIGKHIFCTERQRICRAEFVELRTDEPCHLSGVFSSKIWNYCKHHSYSPALKQACAALTTPATSGAETDCTSSFFRYTRYSILPSGPLTGEKSRADTENPACTA